MSASAPVIVHPPVGGRRRVTIRGEPVGTARGLADLLEFLRRAGLAEDDIPLDDPGFVDWRGGGPGDWPEP
jgi:hypothetical protein